MSDVNSVQNLISTGPTQDHEIDAIIESRKDKKQWPLKRKYCTAYTQELDLFKLRFHKSEKYIHKSVRIPKVDKNEGYGLGNKEGRLICRLCSGKTINRNTSWMCGSCQVPLCVDIINGNPESSCHARWHNCEDLVSVNLTLNTALRERRESKKRNRDSTMNLMEEEPQQQQQQVVAPLPVPQAHHHEVHHPQQEMMKQEVEVQHSQQVVPQEHLNHEVVAVAAPVDHPAAAAGPPNFMEEAHQEHLAVEQRQQQAAAEVAVAALEIPEPAPVAAPVEQQHVEKNYIGDAVMEMDPPDDAKVEDPNLQIVL